MWSGIRDGAAQVGKLSLELGSLALGAVHQGSPSPSPPLPTSSAATFALLTPFFAPPPPYILHNRRARSVRGGAWGSWHCVCGTRGDFAREI